MSSQWKIPRWGYVYDMSGPSRVKLYPMSDPCQDDIALKLGQYRVSDAMSIVAINPRSPNV